MIEFIYVYVPWLSPVRKSSETTFCRAHTRESAQPRETRSSPATQHKLMSHADKRASCARARSQVAHTQYQDRRAFALARSKQPIHLFIINHWLQLLWRWLRPCDAGQCGFFASLSIRSLSVCSNKLVMHRTDASPFIFNFIEWRERMRPSLTLHYFNFIQSGFRVFNGHRLHICW